MNHDARRFEIEVLDVQRFDLAGWQTVAVKWPLVTRLLGEPLIV